MRHLLLASLVALSGSWAAAAHANPCERPQDFVRVADAGQGRAAMVRPYVLKGIAVVALHQRDGQRWLELAVDSAGTARRSLLLEGAAGQQVVEDGGRVLVACDSARATVQAGESALQRLW